MTIDRLLLLVSRMKIEALVVHYIPFLLALFAHFFSILATEKSGCVKYFFIYCILFILFR